METLTLPSLTDDPRMVLQVENKMKNIFVTQLQEPREEDEEDANTNLIPVITESKSRILETGVNTLQRTLLLKKQVELSEVDCRFLQQQKEFKVRTEALENRRAELKRKQQQNKVKAEKFEKFVAESELKQRRALKKYQVEKKFNELKQGELTALTDELEILLRRQAYLKNLMSKHKIFEDYLMKMLDLLPESYYGNGSNSPVLSILRRHETLAITNDDLVSQLDTLVAALDVGQRNLDTLKQEHNTDRLMMNKELSELQTKWDRVSERAKQLEMISQMNQGQSRDQSEEVGTILIAVKNLADQCYLPHYGPLEEIDVLNMIDMTKECILDMFDTEVRVARLVEPDPAITSSFVGRGKGPPTVRKSKKPTEPPQILVDKVPRKHNHSSEKALK